MTPTDPPAANAPAPGLPPVTPPSGRFIAQLFLVPGMIVLVAVLIILGINYLFIGGYTPQYFLSRLDSDNADIRWRGASDLAQHIKRPESKLKSDAAFALDLAERLRTALDDLDQQEKLLAPKIEKLPQDEQDAAWYKLAPQRHFVEFLESALGDFYVPVGVPLLCEIVNREEGPDAKGNTMRRRRAIWALANLGAHVHMVVKELPVEQRTLIIEGLKQEKASGKVHRRLWATNALYHLDKSLVAGDVPGLVLVDRELAKCAKSQDRNLRMHIALALNFWDGETTEATLLELARDNGYGTLVGIGDVD